MTTPVVLAPGHFDAHAFRNLAETMTEPLRYTSLVPVQLARLCDAATDDLRTRAVLRRFTAILVGGQAMPSELQTRAEELDLRVVRTYGSSETAGGCVYNGVPIGNTRVRAVGGQLEISGAVLAEGYLGEPERTRQRFSEVHGVRWYRTGDLGTVDPLSGVVRVLGRADNVIISGGVKVSLDEVEAIVRAFPGLENAVVVAANDPEWGQVPVIVAAGSSATRVELVETSVETRIADAVSSVLGRAARPARFVIVPSIPLLTSGKPDRRAITAAL
ncbi:AMP-binding enzyme [Cryobacterium roopkundense]|uniref:AMP-binding enzyme n=1 Tax=Cryobacterium roopkundense TaxID=1001240 RepID=UPI002686C669